ncbi:CBL-interacting protein kinase 5-like isoform X1 [Capsicum chacoense]
MHHLSSMMSMKIAKTEKKGTILMHKYEIGKLLGQGTFSKVYYARNLKTSQNVAVKVIDKEKVMKVGLIDQIKREISVMRLIRHPNVVELYEVMASKTKIYFAMEYVKGGELFNKVAKGSRGVYHRDLKPENILLDETGNLKVSDFGLSALYETKRQDGFLHTTCGTPAYVAPEIINKRGYDGEKADIWSCGVILFVLLAGYLPFHDANLMGMYKKISKGEFKCPEHFPSEVKKLLSRILDPNPFSRITLAKLMNNNWFKKGFKQIDKPPILDQEEDKSPRSIFDIVDDSDAESSSGHKEQSPSTMKPTCLNAFDIISLSPAFDLSNLFEKDKSCRSDARFTTQNSASTIVSRLEEVASMGSFKVKKKDGTVKMQGSKQGRKGQLEIDAEIFEITPAFHVVEVKKKSGDTAEYMKFCDQGLKPSLKDIVWTWQGNEQQHVVENQENETQR